MAAVAFLWLYFNIKGHILIPFSGKRHSDESQNLPFGFKTDPESSSG